MTAKPGHRTVTPADRFPEGACEAARLPEPDAFAALEPAPVLLHSCCAPCSSAILEWLLARNYRPTVFFYNPNIFPREEYDVRRNECIRYCEALGIPFVDGDYEHDRWREAVKGLENEPERGARCAVCFRERMRAAALAAAGSIMALVMLQPDLGSTLVYAVMLAAVLIAAGTPVKVLAGMAAAGLAMLPLGWMVLKPYQRMRLLVFIDPTVDPQGAGYNVIQSRIAVGSGGLFGKGFMHGTQGKLHFLPEPHTDFIFSVFSEEFGFAGCVVVLFLFGVLLLRVLAVSQYTKDVRAKLMCVAIAAWLWFQIFESVAMSMGLAPVTGLPLPLFSYGGSSLLVICIALGLVQSAHIVARRERF